MLTLVLPTEDGNRQAFIKSVMQLASLGKSFSAPEAVAVWTAPEEAMVTLA